MYAVKFMKKHEIIKLKQVDHINNEKRLMAQIPHPFIVSMIGFTKAHIEISYLERVFNESHDAETHGNSKAT